MENEDVQLPTTSRPSPIMEEEESIAAIVPVPPDGGWGWVIIFVCCIGNLAIDTVLVSFPPIQHHMAKHVNRSMTEISLIISVYSCLYSLVGPFSGAIANRIGFRLTMLIGGCMASCGLGVCFFSYHFEVYIACAGVFAGLGGSLVYMASLAAPGFWFEEKRALAAGISSCAAGLSAIVVPFGAVEVEKKVGWRYVLFIPTGVYVVLCCLSFLIRTAPSIYVESKPPRRKPKAALQKKDVISYTSKISVLGPAHSATMKRTLQIGGDVGLEPKRISTATPEMMRRPRGKCTCCKTDTQTTIERPMYKKDVFYQGSVMRIREKNKLRPGEYTLTVARTPTLKDVREEVECKCIFFPEAFKRGIKTLFNFEVFKNKSFLMVLCSSFFFYNAVSIPYIFLKRIGIDNKMEENTADLLLPLVGAGVTSSRCTVGLIMMMFPRLRAHIITVVGLSASSLICLGLCFNFDKAYQLTMNFFLGYSFGIYLPLRSVILMDYVGLEKLTSAMGFIFTLQGIGSLSGIPTAELLVAYLDDSRWALYYTSAGFLVSMVFLIPIFCFEIPLEKERIKEKRFDKVGKNYQK